MVWPTSYLQRYGTQWVLQYSSYAGKEYTDHNLSDLPSRAFPSFIMVQSKPFMEVMTPRTVNPCGLTTIPAVIYTNSSAFWPTSEHSKDLLYMNHPRLNAMWTTNSLPSPEEL